MKFETNKEKGNTGLAVAIGYFGSNGYIVSTPLNDTQDYDLIIDLDNTLSRVQVKATNQTAPSGSYKVSVRSCGGTNGGVYKRIVDTEIELLFILCGDKSMYLIPKDAITCVNSITLGVDYQKYRLT